MAGKAHTFEDNGTGKLLMSAFEPRDERPTPQETMFFEGEGCEPDRAFQRRAFEMVCHFQQDRQCAGIVIRPRRVEDGIVMCPDQNRCRMVFPGTGRILDGKDVPIGLPPSTKGLPRRRPSTVSKLLGQIPSAVGERLRISFRMTFSGQCMKMAGNSGSSIRQGGSQVVNPTRLSLSRCPCV